MFEFINMGGHGSYIWSGYGVSVVLIAILALKRLEERRALRKKFVNELSNRIKDEEG